MLIFLIFLFFYMLVSSTKNVFINSVCGKIDNNKTKMTAILLLCFPQFRNCLNFLKRWKRLSVTWALWLSHHICWKKNKKQTKLRR